MATLAVAVAIDTATLAVAIDMATLAVAVAIDMATLAVAVPLSSFEVSNCYKLHISLANTQRQQTLCNYRLRVNH